jgi:hypothetical protein
MMHTAVGMLFIYGKQELAIPNLKIAVAAIAPRV